MDFEIWISRSARSSARRLAGFGFAVGAGLLAALCAVPEARAQRKAEAYPVRPIRLIVPFPPGGTSDLLGRLIGTRLGEALGQSVIMDNRGGAGGTLGAGLAARAPADGYTLLIHHNGLAIAETTYPGLPYSAPRDFAPISKIGLTPHAVVVNNALAAHTMQDLLELARKSPGKYDYGSGGTGSIGHLAVTLLEQIAGVTLNHVPFKGGGPSVMAAVAGQVHLAVPVLPTTVPHVQAKRLRMLAVTGARRSATMPDVPTVMEAGVPGYELVVWFAMYAPAGTPAAIVTRLNLAIVKSLESAELRDQVTRAGVDPETSTPEDLGRLLRSDTARWAKVIKAAGITLN
jgi:tripartite-type tricarboxylate transporter receptor subunit TctC